ncbi:hypothetical protein [Yersinia bercovieri]|uniref:hypothetical protein n=1 Tax=Yersinia bercovieri TaxID=634 RepID=UPI0005E5B8DD|nr:hypothetical protein [Yersinia bercovieri]MDN0105131.1 hypothetical protein [Yersinia bercovieri]CNJ07826.1 rhs family protein [Yersinia bercovieri]
MNNKNIHDHHATDDNNINLEKQAGKRYKDKNGDQLTDKYDNNGKLIWSERLVCNKKGEITSKVITNFSRDEKGRIINRHDTIYNAAGELIECEERLNMGQGKSAKTKKIKYKYLGEMISKVEEILDSSKRLLSKVVQSVDIYGNVLLSEEYDKNNKVIKEIESITNRDYKITGCTEKHYSGEGELTSRVEMTKFSYGNASVYYEELTFDSHGDIIEVASISKKFDDNGNVLSQQKEIYDNKEELEDGNFSKEIEEEFDAKGNLIYRDETSADCCENTIIRQEFDSSGELISKVEEEIKRQNGQMYSHNKDLYGANDIMISAVEIWQNFDKTSGKLTDRTETTYSYDPQGNTIGSVKTVEKFATDGEQTSSVTENYDAYGEKIEVEPIELLPEAVNNPLSEQLAPTINNNSDVNIFESYDPKYSDKGELISSRRVTTVSDNTRVIVECTYQNGEVASEIKTTEDMTGKVLNELSKTFNSDGEETSYSRREYNASGKVIANFNQFSRFGGKSDQLISAMNGFGTNRGVAAPADKILMPTINSSMLVAPL